jgi:hypothetical protein
MKEYTVADLIEFLQTIEDKTIPVRVWNNERDIADPINWWDYDSTEFVIHY